MTSKQAFFSIILWMGIVTLIGYSSTGSLHPLAIYHTDKMALKIISTLGLFVSGASFIALLVIIAFPGKCAHDGKELIKYAQILGPPIKCRYCGLTYHKKCLEALGGSVMHGCRQPGCPSYQPTNYQ